MVFTVNFSTTHMAKVDTWSLKGQYFETCNCEAACPCVFLSPPTEGDCKLLASWHIEEGNYGGVSLEGLNVLLAVFSPGHMLKVKWKAALYLDERADQPQKDALTKIFAGQSGGTPAALAPFIGEVLGVKSVPMEFRVEGRKRSLTIPKVARVDVEGIPGQDGGEVVINNPPFIAVPGVPVVAAKSKGVRYKDYGLDWNFSERNSYYTNFRYVGP